MISDAAPPSLLSYARAARIPIVEQGETICPTCEWEARDGEGEEDACPECGYVGALVQSDRVACAECIAEGPLTPEGSGE